MLLTQLLVIGGYLVACGVALSLHEAAHYIIHRRSATSVTIGVNRYGPYVEAQYDKAAPTYAMRLGSLAPTLLYTPFVVTGIFGYLMFYSVPVLDPLSWTFLLVPIALLIVPTGADLHGALYAHHYHRQT